MTNAVLIAQKADRKSGELLSSTSALVSFQANLPRVKEAPAEKMPP